MTTVVGPEGMVQSSVAQRGVAGSSRRASLRRTVRRYHGDLQIYYVHYAYASIYAFRGRVHRRKRASRWLPLGSRQHMSRGTITAMQIPLPAAASADSAVPRETLPRLV